MEPYSSSRAEAERWLGIAEKLLTTRDLIGSKTFAIRARESGTWLEPANRILAVADTLLAGEKRMNNQHDWYAILQLVNRTHNSELIATQYRRLALLLNPIKNTLAFADEAFKLVSDAWSVLSNPSKKFIFDNKLDPAVTTGPNRAQEQEQEQEHQEPQHYKQQQQQQAVRRNPRNSNNSSKEKNITEESEVHYTNDGNSSFWTACPYCYNMYEYARVYEDCTLRCQNCRRAFQALTIPSPPPNSEGEEGYFCCWGFFPLGVSMSNLEKNKGAASNWAPFSPMFTYPQVPDKPNVTAPKPKNVNFRKTKSSAPRIYIDDDPDVLVEILESSEDSDDEWNRTKRKKKARNMRGKGSAGKNVKKPQADKQKNVKGGTGQNLPGGSLMQEGMGVPNASNIETSKKAVANNSKKQSGKVAKELGKLDLNVEFSNELEEHVPGMREGHGAGNGEEDGIEGTGFFEGLDEFLSSLPILSIVGGEKVKAT